MHSAFRSRLLSALVLLGAHGMQACVGADDDDTKAVATAAPLIYDDDDRQEAFEHVNPVLRDLARYSTVALIPRGRLERDAAPERGPSVGELEQLCAGERFAEQPGLAECTGVLIAPDVVLTAGHCFGVLEVIRGQACDAYDYVFGYLYPDVADLDLDADLDADAGAPELGAMEVYRCGRLLAHEVGERDGGRVDYALVELERAVREPLRPVTWPDPMPDAARPWHPEGGASMAVIGAPLGAPLKIDCHGRVVAELSDTMFSLHVDAFRGQSGGGVFDEDGQLRGILTGGLTDLEPAQDAGQDCLRTRRVEASETRAERALVLEPALDALCALRDLPALCQHAQAERGPSSQQPAMPGAATTARLGGSGGCSLVALQPLAGPDRAPLPPPSAACALCALVLVTRRRRRPRGEALGQATPAAADAVRPRSS